MKLAYFNNEGAKNLKINSKNNLLVRKYFQEFATKVANYIYIFSNFTQWWTKSLAKWPIWDKNEQNLKTFLAINCMIKAKQKIQFGQYFCKWHESMIIYILNSLKSKIVLILAHKKAFKKKKVFAAKFEILIFTFKFKWNFHFRKKTFKHL